MASYSLSLPAPFAGTKISDFTVAANAPGAGDIELRLSTVDAQGNRISTREIVLALEALERQFSAANNPNVSVVSWPSI